MSKFIKGLKLCENFFNGCAKGISQFKIYGRLDW